MSDLPTYLAMIAVGFVAGTFIPFVPASSEVFFAGLLATKNAEPAVLVAVATLGNVLGAVLNFVIGRQVAGLSDRKWFPATEPQLQFAGRQFNRWGVWILLMSWVPILGDLVTVVAGVLRTEFKQFLLLTSIGKFLRYAAIACGVVWLYA